MSFIVTQKYSSAPEYLCHTKYHYSEIFLTQAEGSKNFLNMVCVSLYHCNCNSNACMYVIASHMQLVHTARQNSPVHLRKLTTVAPYSLAGMQGQRQVWKKMDTVELMSFVRLFRCWMSASVHQLSDRVTVWAEAIWSSSVIAEMNCILSLNVIYCHEYTHRLSLN